MRTGISSPILALSGGRPQWEHDADIKTLTHVFTTADRLGYEFMTAPDHIAVPPGLERGERFYDALSTFSFLASVTSRIRFLPYVLVIGFSHPLEYAKRWGTLDYLSGGRVTLGFGVGNLREEFDMLGVPFDDRGARADDALKALRASLGKRVVSYHGEYYQFDDMVIDPHATQEHLPIWIGGHSKRALRRAVTLADGWCPAPVNFRGPDWDQLKSMLGEVDLPEGFDVLVGPIEPLDPMGNPEQVREVLGTAAENGGTVFRLTVKHNSMAEYLDQLAAYAELAGLAIEK